MKTTAWSCMGFCALAIVIFFSGSCLFFVPDVDLDPVGDQNVQVNQQLIVPLVASSGNREIGFTYSIDNSGWQEIEGNTFLYTFTEAGEYLITINASNGLKGASTTFTVIVSPE